MCLVIGMTVNPLLVFWSLSYKISGLPTRATSSLKTISKKVQNGQEGWHVDDLVNVIPNTTSRRRMYLMPGRCTTEARGGKMLVVVEGGKPP